MSKEIKYPYIVFKLVDTYYCVSSECISTIVQLPQYDKIPESPETVTGMFRYRNQVIQMLDLRTTFGFKSLAEECRDFEKMIDARKLSRQGLPFYLEETRTSVPWEDGMTVLHRRIMWSISICERLTILIRGCIWQRII